MSQLTRTLSQYWTTIQGTLFPWLQEELDPLTKKQQQLIEILELVRIEELIPIYFGCEGRPQKTRAAIARAFVAKMIYNIDTTTFLIERADCKTPPSSGLCNVKNDSKPMVETTFLIQPRSSEVFFSKTSYLRAA